MNKKKYLLYFSALIIIIGLVHLSCAKPIVEIEGVLGDTANTSGSTELTGEAGIQGYFNVTPEERHERGGIDGGVTPPAPNAFPSKPPKINISIIVQNDGNNITAGEPFNVTIKIKSEDETARNVTVELNISELKFLSGKINSKNFTDFSELKSELNFPEITADWGTEEIFLTLLADNQGIYELSVTVNGKNFNTTTNKTTINVTEKQTPETTPETTPELPEPEPIINITIVCPDNVTQGESFVITANVSVTNAPVNANITLNIPPKYFETESRLSESKYFVQGNHTYEWKISVDNNAPSKEYTFYVDVKDLDGKVLNESKIKIEVLDAPWWGKVEPWQWIVALILLFFLLYILYVVIRKKKKGEKSRVDKISEDGRTKGVQEKAKEALKKLRGLKEEEPEKEKEEGTLAGIPTKKKEEGTYAGIPTKKKEEGTTAGVPTKKKVEEIKEKEGLDEERKRFIRESARQYFEKMKRLEEERKMMERVEEEKILKEKELKKREEEGTYAGVPTKKEKEGTYAGVPTKKEEGTYAGVPTKKEKETEGTYAGIPTKKETEREKEEKKLEEKRTGLRRIQENFYKGGGKKGSKSPFKLISNVLGKISRKFK